MGLLFREVLESLVVQAEEAVNKRRYAQTYHVWQHADGSWCVFRANVGGDFIFVAEFETKMAAQWRAAELTRREEENGQS